MTVTPSQVASVLMKAANLRTDVKKARITVEPDYDPTMLLVEITFYTEGKRYERETPYHKHLDRTCGAILDDWIGPLAPRPAALVAREQVTNGTLVNLRKQYLNNTVADVLTAIKSHKHNPPPPPQRSKFKWSSPRPTPENPTGIIKTPIPEGPVEATAGPDDPSHPAHKFEPMDDKARMASGRYYKMPTGEVLPKLKRSAMILKGMDSAARAAQYKLQRGKHPDEKVG